MKRGLIIGLIALLLLVSTGTAIGAKGRPASDWIVRDTAEQALRAAADFIAETGSEPLDVEIYHGTLNDELWTVEIIWQ